MLLLLLKLVHGARSVILLSVTYLLQLQML
jgi:hypothetical protein